MSKVLVSFIGTGQLDRTKGEDSRTYKEAKYCFGDGAKEEISTTFIADALAQHYQVDKIILIGTVKSMWEGVYEAFTRRNGIAMDEDYYVRLGDHCDNATNKSALEIPDQNKLEQVLGKDSKIVLINYGIDEKQLRNNAASILGIEQELAQNDELIVDITHAFRSLPLYLMNLLIYLHNVSNKNITISHITYGMLDISRELGYAPVVELSDIMTINDWITGASSLSNSGDGYQIAELLRNEGRTDVASRLTSFSNTMNISHLGGIWRQIGNIAAMKNFKFDPIPEKIIPPVIKQFSKQFSSKDKLSIFQLQVARWQFNHSNYSASFLSVLESIVTFVCEEEGWDTDDITTREKAKQILCWKINDYQTTHKIDGLHELRELYKTIRFIRNAIAHSQIDKKTLSADKMIRDLENTLNTLERIWSSQGTNNKAVNNTRKGKLFINLSNHPSSSWSDEQRNAALKYGEIIDMDFPQIKSTGDENYVSQSVQQKHAEILQLAKTNNVTVHVMGESNFVFTLVSLLRLDDIKCVASTTERIVEEEEGKKISTFKFVQFREYR